MLNHLGTPPFSKPECLSLARSFLAPENVPADVAEKQEFWSVLDKPGDGNDNDSNNHLPQTAPNNFIVSFHTTVP